MEEIISDRDNDRIKIVQYCFLSNKFSLMGKDQCQPEVFSLMAQNTRSQ